MYLAAQGDNPFGSHLRPLLVLHDTEERGALIKIPGRIDVDPADRADHHGLQRHAAVPLRRPHPEVPERSKGPARQPPDLRQADDRGRSRLLRPAPEPGRCLQHLRGDRRPQRHPLSAGLGQSAPSTRPSPEGPSTRSPAPTRPFLFRSPERRRTGTEPGHHHPAPGPGRQDRRRPLLPRPGDRLDLHRGGSRRARAQQPRLPRRLSDRHRLRRPGSRPGPNYFPGKVYLAGPYKGAPLSLAIVAPASPALRPRQRRGQGRPLRRPRHHPGQSGLRSLPDDPPRSDLAGSATCG